MFSRLFTFSIRRQPYMVRSSYRYELASALTYPLAASLAEGGFTGVVAAKYFGASQLLIAVITAAPMFGNIMALLWAELARTRRKVPFVNMLQMGVVTVIAAAGFTRFVPSKELGGWLFAILIIAARVFASGILTVRSAIWRSNYPRQLRGQIIGRISVAATTVLAAATFFGSWWLDRNKEAFVWLYPAAAFLGAIGVWQFSHIRVRHEGQALRRQRQALYTPRPESAAMTDEANVLNYDPNSRANGHGLYGGVRRFFALFAEAKNILKNDAAFRRYQRWQFITGASFMMFGPSLLYMVSKEMTNEKTDYLKATIIVQILPLVMSLLFTQVWAPLFDRMHITWFRVVQTTISVVAQFMIFVGAIAGLSWSNTGGLWIIGAAQVLIGISLAGGNLAWNLGHNQFATAEKSGSYMAVHVMLTGLRGCLAPFLGAALYTKFGLGRYVFLCSAVLCLIGLMGFWSMARERSRQTLAPSTVETTVAHA